MREGEARNDLHPLLNSRSSRRKIAKESKRKGREEEEREDHNIFLAFHCTR